MIGSTPARVVDASRARWVKRSIAWSVIPTRASIRRVRGVVTAAGDKGGR